jgi:hypothetical protein
MLFVSSEINEVGEPSLAIVACIADERLHKVREECICMV